MKLKPIGEIATKRVPVWQPILLIALLLFGYFAIPLIAKKNSALEKKNKSIGSTLGVSTIKEQFNNGMNTIVKPAANQLQQEAGVVLGRAQRTAQQKMQKVASSSANQAKEFILENTLGKVLQNINALPKDQQDFIKKAICK